jgi:hypothetical protein
MRSINIPKKLRMRILFTFLILCSLSFFAQAQSKAKGTTKKTSNSGGGIPAGLKFKDTYYEFGQIKQGEVVTHDFDFINMTKKPLVISNASATCGCTTPSYPFIPVEPGESGTIGITFNSKNKLGNQSPTITVTSNMGTFKLNMKGIVTD